MIALQMILQKPYNIAQEPTLSHTLQEQMWQVALLLHGLFLSHIKMESSFGANQSPEQFLYIFESRTIYFKFFYTENVLLYILATFVSSFMLPDYYCMCYWMSICLFCIYKLDKTDEIYHGLKTCIYICIFCCLSSAMNYA
jgi:hypothetical protein